MNGKTCLVVVGPTAVGKTSFAIELAKKFQTHIISADSRQCFHELNIGVAKPSTAQLNEIKHYFINSHSIQEEVNAAVFEKYSLVAVSEIFLEHDVAIMVGGTGLYINAFCDGLDAMPAIEDHIRQAIIAGYNTNGLEWLQQAVAQNDPDYYKNGEMLNPRRLMRALEVKLSTGQSIRSFQFRKKNIRDFDIIKIGLDLSKQDLHERINHRVDEMIENGLTDEVQSLVLYKYMNALNTVGYKEMFSYLDGQISLEEAIELIKKNTRQYAKRQITWFKKDAATTWSNPSDDSIVNGLLKR